MPVNARVVAPLSLVYVEYSGKVRVDEAERALNACFASPSYSIEMDKVADLTKVSELDAGFTEIRNFAKNLSLQYEVKKPATKLCIVANTSISERSAQMFADLAATVNHPGDIHIVPGFPEVLTILGLPNDALALLPARCRTEASLLTGLRP